jgi:hypothetical protein
VGSITQAVGGTNDFDIIDERTWQGGRGAWCDLWSSLEGLLTDEGIFGKIDSIAE